MSGEARPLLIAHGSDDQVGGSSYQTSCDSELESQESNANSLPNITESDLPKQILVKNNEATTRSKTKSFWSKIDSNAIQFGTRVGVLMAFSSLFVLIRTEKYQYPDGMWVLITVLFVSWFPAMDAASVIEKIVQRLIGTLIGAVLGLCCGFSSLIFASDRNIQVYFLVFCMFLFNFLIVSLAGQCKVGGMKVIQRFAYATILCVLTFCICMLPFGSLENPKWKHGVWRIIDVIVGCIIGAVGSIYVCPKSTTDVLYEKAVKQVKMAGDASGAVLIMAADYFAGRIEINRLADELLRSPLESELRWRLAKSGSLSSADSTEATSGATDVALKKFEESISDWKSAKMLFPLARYDPFRLGWGDKSLRAEEFHQDLARTLARTLRIQTTVVVLDGMVRSDADYNFNAFQLECIAETGHLIQHMLSLPIQSERNDMAARALFEKLEEIRSDVFRMSAAVSHTEEHSTPERDQSLKEFQANLLSGNMILQTTRSEMDDLGRGVPKKATGSNDNTLFFLQLVEHLVLRSLRLYQTWKSVNHNLRK